MRSTRVFGGLLIAIGVILLLATVQGGVSFGELVPWLWPLVLVWLGAWLLVAASERRTSSPSWGSDMAAGPWPSGEPRSAPAPDPRAWQPAPPSAGVTPEAATRPDAAAAAYAAAAASGTVPSSGSDRAWRPVGQRVESGAPYRQQRFIGEVEVAGPFDAGPMRIETFIGEVRLDLTRAAFPDGETPVRVNTGIGEVRVLLPADIPAAVRVSTLLGEAEAIGRTAGPVLGEAYGETDGFASARRRIRLEAQALIGEVRVRRARSDGTAFDAPGSGFAPVSSPGGFWPGSQAAGSAPTSPQQPNGPDSGASPAP